MPRISVVIPCYNSYPYLVEAIDSITAQTVTDYELIIVDDGSTDPKTIDFLKTVSLAVQVYYKENGGPASARNMGIQNSTGEIIITLDGDDKFAKTFFAEALAIVDRQPEVGVVSSYVQEIGKSSKIWRTTAYDDFSFLFENRIVACCAFRRQCWIDAGGYDETMHLGLEDWDYWINVTKKGWKVHIIPKPLFFYRKKDSSLMVDKTHPNMAGILDYMVDKHRPWFLFNMKKGILDKKFINKNNLTLRRIAGLFFEKLNGKF